MDHPCLDEIDLAEFTDLLKRKASEKDVPLSGSVEVTAGCNLNCVHCYIRPQQTNTTGELTASEWMRVIDEIAEHGCLWLLLTGGEPFTRPDFLQIYDHAMMAGRLVTLFTNGTTITPEIADHLADLPPRMIEITLYGRTRETYERITAVPGSHERCLTGIQLLLERKLPLKLKTMAMTLNVHEIDAMKAFADERGLEFRFDTDLNPRLDGCMAPTRLRIPPSDVVSLDRSHEERTKDLRDLYLRSLDRGNPRREFVFRCGAASATFHVDSNGNLSPCMMARHPAKSLRETPLREALKSLAATVRDMRAATASPCRKCHLASVSGVCPGRSEMETGNPESDVQYFCQVAHLRAEVHELGR